MQQRPIAVMIFGILNIGFGLLDLLVTLLFMVVLPKMNAPDNPILKQMQVTPWEKITMPLDGIAAVALLAAGIGLLLSRNWARVLSIVYAVYFILECTVGCMVKLIGATSMMVMLGAVMVGIVSLVYPVLLVVFMRRPNVVAALKPALPVP